MSQQGLLIRILKILEKSGIGYMITGSIVSSLQGEPRATHDIDIVIAINRESVRIIVDLFDKDDFYITDECVIDAVDRKSMFNIIDMKEGDKVDFWILTEDPFDRERFKRKYAEDAFGEKMYVSSPEDTILAKLRWCKLCNSSEKQFIDALRVYEVQYSKLDINYMEHWVKSLNVELLWDRLKNEAVNL